MRLRLSLVVLLLSFGLLARPGFAQLAASGGVMGGVNLGDLSFDPESSEFPCCDMKAGGVFGAFANLGTDMVSFQPEFLYSMKGAKVEQEDAKIKLNFVQIPLLLRANLTSQPVRPFFVIGPGISFRTSAKLDGPGGEEDIKDQTKSTDFGVIFGGGLAFGPGAVELRYDLGLRNLSDDPTENVEVKTRTLSILFSVSFGRR